MPTMTGWQAVVKALKAEDIHFVYGLPGSPKDLYDALYDEPSIKAIQARHEAAGGFMAMAHALSTENRQCALLVLAQDVPTSLLLFWNL